MSPRTRPTRSVTTWIALLALSATSAACTRIIEPFDRVGVVCGDGWLTAPYEQCDGNLLAGQSCTLRGYYPGELRCGDDCKFDYTGCGGKCGDGIVQTEWETCDGDLDPGVTCQNQVAGSTGGDLTCDDCELDTSQCWVCGNGVRDPGESCDGTDFGGDGCSAYAGGPEGFPLCNADCTPNTTECYTCGDGECQLASGETAESCPGDCAFVDISVGSAHACGVRMDGSVWCWGGNEHGELGTGATGGPSFSPVKVDLQAWVHRVCAGTDFACALDEHNGDLYCWGNNDRGQLGIGTLGGTQPTPQMLDGLSTSGVTDFSCGSQFACAVTVTEVHCWGSNAHGKLGTGDTATNVAESANPMIVDFAAFTGVGLTQVELGEHHACARAEDGDIYCWGAGGGLGDGSGVDSPLPVQVPLPEKSDRRLMVGGRHACVLERSVPPVVRCWGDNQDGQFGDGSTSSAATPATWPSAGYSPATLDGGLGHTCGTSSTGWVYCHGNNTQRQSGGDGNACSFTGSEPIPLVILKPDNTPLSDILRVSAGDGSSCAVDTAGRAWCWGTAASGLLGIGPDPGECTHQAQPVIK